MSGDILEVHTQYFSPIMVVGDFPQSSWRRDPPTYEGFNFLGEEVEPGADCKKVVLQISLNEHQWFWDKWVVDKGFKLCETFVNGNSNNLIKVYYKVHKISKQIFEREKRVATPGPFSPDYNERHGYDYHPNNCGITDFSRRRYLAELGGEEEERIIRDDYSTNGQYLFTASLTDYKNRKYGEWLQNNGWRKVFKGAGVNVYHKIVEVGYLEDAYKEDYYEDDY